MAGKTFALHIADYIWHKRLPGAIPEHCCILAEKKREKSPKVGFYGTTIHSLH